MGLDITAYRNLREVDKEDAFDEDGDLVDYDMIHINLEGQDPDRAAGLKEGAVYTSDDTMGFRAGSYSGYGAWREELARLAGYKPVPSRYGRADGSAAEAVWQNPVPGPFMELINFSDCEGIIGPVVSKKLALDFARFQEKADAHPDGYFRERYNDWRRAFEMAADGGAVDFH